MRKQILLYSEFYNLYKGNNNLAKMELKAKQILLGEVWDGHINKNLQTYFMSCGQSVTVVIIMTNQRKSLGNPAWCNNISLRDSRSTWVGVSNGHARHTVEKGVLSALMDLHPEGECSQAGRISLAVYTGPLGSYSIFKQ